MIVRLLPLLMMISVFSGNSSMASSLTRNRGNNLSPIKLDQNWNTTLPLSSVTWKNFDVTAHAMYITNTGRTLRLTAKWPIRKTPAVLFCESGQRFHFFELHLHWSHHSNKGTDHVIYSERGDIEVHAVFRKVAGDGNAKLLSFAKLYKHDETLPFSSVGLRLMALHSSNVINAGSSKWLPKTIKLQDLISPFEPETRIFMYMGSLMFPPLKEGIVWLVSASRGVVHDTDLEAFRSLLDTEGRPISGNVRPLQPRNERFIALLV